MKKAMGRGTLVLAILGLILVWGQPGWSDPGDSRRSEAGAGLPRLLSLISSDRMLADVARLSHPDMGGRQAGTRGDLRSARHVFDAFRASIHLGRRPADVQDPDLRSDRLTVTRIRDHARLELLLDGQTRALSVGRDYLPILDSPSANVLGRVVFVGYGIADPARGFDEYEGLDVRDRIVLFLRGTPSTYPVRVSHAEKEGTARERGAVAFLTATGPIRSAYELRRGIPPGPLAFYGLDGAARDRTLPGAWISTEAASALVSSSRLSLQDIQRRFEEELVPRSQPLPALVRLRWNADSFTGTLNNVVMRYPGSRTDGVPESIVIGAHRDHFGVQAGLLFPGADDNASGTAVLLEVARVLREGGSAPTRSLVFVSFSGEERGLLGSRFYVRRPAHPLRHTVAMINLDHVGAGNGRLTVGVAGLPGDLAANAAHLVGLEDKVDFYGYFPGGDHVPFREAGVPTITVVSGGPHDHFHQPSDRPETVQPAILTGVARYVLALVWLLAYDS